MEVIAFVTEKRKNVLLRLVSNLQNDIASNNIKKYVIDGPQGTGKTYTMLILSHVLRSFKKVK